MAKRPKIVKGQDATVSVQLYSEKKTCTTYSLAGMTGCTGYFEKTDGTFEAVSGTLVSADLGKLAFSLSDTQTLDLAEGDEQSFEVHVEKSAEKFIVQILQKLEVVASLLS